MAADQAQRAAQRAAQQARWRHIWQSRQWPAWGWLPISWLYGSLAGLQRQLYRMGILRSTRLKCPVLVVGNVIAGGAGKTPTTIALVQHLQRRGFLVGIVSRGHRRDTQACLEVTDTSSASDVGDEPLLMHRRTGAPVFVASQRAQAGEALLQAHPRTELIVCDDALQHHALAHDWSLCVFDERGVGNGWLLPAGPLREPWPRAVTWSLQICEADNRHLDRPVPDSFPAWRQLAGHTENWHGQRITLQALAQSARPLVALAGIAKPEVFFKALQQQGLSLHQTLHLADHASISAEWLSQALPQGVASVDDADDPRPLLLCTEKDAVKLWAICPQALAVPLNLQLPEALLQAVERQLVSKLKH